MFVLKEILMVKTVDNVAINIDDGRGSYMRTIYSV